ncbi:MAG: transposase family protein [Desulfovibrionaceae bacterium]|nr:transposase family protein [Desulfovibrionaceae bacterium]
MNISLSLWDRFGQIPDPRNPSGRRYSLQSILALITVALLNGQTSLRAISIWGRTLTRKQLEKLGIRRKKSPSQTTMHYLLTRLDPSIIETSLNEWFKNAASISLPDLPKLPSLRGLKDEYRALAVLGSCCTALSRRFDRFADDLKQVDLNAGLDALRLLFGNIPSDGKAGA